MQQIAQTALDVQVLKMFARNAHAYGATSLTFNLRQPLVDAGLAEIASDANGVTLYKLTPAGEKSARAARWI